MDIIVDPGKYIAAVSGGVDSMALLDLLKKQIKVDIVIAHFNHGIRADASLDEELIKEVANKHRLPIEVGYGDLGQDASENTAREARYRFLEKVRKKHVARAIITAHHQDDLVETAFINILRGTGSRGLTSMLMNPKIVRPLMSTSKQDLVNYATKNNIAWREDATNMNTAYLRNYLRRNVIPNLSKEKKHELLENIEEIRQGQIEADKLISEISKKIMANGKINRMQFCLLPTEIANELVVYWLRGLEVEDIDKKTVERINITIKTALPSTKHNVRAKLWIFVEGKTAYFTTAI